MYVTFSLLIFKVVLLLVSLWETTRYFAFCTSIARQSEYASRDYDHAVKINTGVTGQNIPPAGVYPGILWPRPIYTPGYILA